jgi:hypothetical protein
MPNKPLHLTRRKQRRAGERSRSANIESHASLEWTGGITRSTEKT